MSVPLDEEYGLGTGTDSMALTSRVQTIVGSNVLRGKGRLGDVTLSFLRPRPKTRFRGDDRHTETRSTNWRCSKLGK